MFLYSILFAVEMAQSNEQVWENVDLNCYEKFEDLSEMEYTHIDTLSDGRVLYMAKSQIISPDHNRVGETPMYQEVSLYDTGTLYNVSIYDEWYSHTHKKKEQTNDYIADSTQGIVYNSICWNPEDCKFKDVYLNSDFTEDVYIYYKKYKDTIKHTLRAKFKRFCTQMQEAAVDANRTQRKNDNDKIDLLKESKKLRQLIETPKPKDFDFHIKTAMLKTTKLYSDLRAAKFKNNITKELAIKRADALMWLAVQCKNNQCLRPTYFLAVDYFDRFIMAAYDCFSDFRLIAITCLFIATKVESGYSATDDAVNCAKLFFNTIADSIEVQQIAAKIIKLELILMREFGFLVTPVTCIDWLDFLYQQRQCKLRRANLPTDDPRRFCEALAVMDVCSLNSTIMEFRPDLIARSVIGYVVERSIPTPSVKSCLNVISCLNINLSHAPQHRGDSTLDKNPRPIRQIFSKKREFKENAIPPEYAFRYYKNDTQHLKFSTESIKFMQLTNKI